MRSSFVLRARLLSGFFVLVALVLVGRLYIVQIVRASGYQKDAVSQYVAQSPENKIRGTIFLTTKDGQLVAGAAMQSGWRIAISPSDIKDPEKTYTELNAIAPLDRERFFS